MAIATPFNLGNASYGFSNGSNMAATTVRAPPGSLVVVAIFPQDNNTTITGFGGDHRGNTYQMAFQSTPTASTPAFSVWFCPSTVFDIPVNSFFGPITTADAGAFEANAFCCPSGAGGGLDRYAFTTNTSSVTSASIGTGTLTVANELAFGFLVSPVGLQFGGSSNSVTETITGGVGTELYDGQFYATTYGIVSSTSPVTYSPSWPTSNAYTIAVATFQATPTGQVGVQGLASVEI